MTDEDYVQELIKNLKKLNIDPKYYNIFIDLYSKYKIDKYASLKLYLNARKISKRYITSIRIYRNRI